MSDDNVIDLLKNKKAKDVEDHDYVQQIAECFSHVYTGGGSTCDFCKKRRSFADMIIGILAEDIQSYNKTRNKEELTLSDMQLIFVEAQYKLSEIMMDAVLSQLEEENNATTKSSEGESEVRIREITGTKSKTKKRSDATPKSTPEDEF